MASLQALSIFILSFLTRFYRIGYPRSVVFDELHYIKFITLYGKRIFFFDPQPPFGKQLLTLTSQFIGFQGDLSYSKIGDNYKPEVPLEALRLLPCICGSLIAPICYLIGIELKFSKITAGVVSILIVFENSLIIQSRFILLDSILILFSTLTFYAYLKFSNTHSLRWLFAASIMSTLAACTKYSGLYTYAFLLALVVHLWWHQLDKTSSRSLAKRSMAYSCVVIVPIILYVCIHYAHLAWLTKAGPHDTIMTSAFQASLEGGLASITKGQPLEIVHGSQITLRHTHGRSCWLHSHEHLYPVKYHDGRGSSHQQQVTCYSFKDVNNWWIVKRPSIEELVVREPLDRIQNGDIVQLVHGMTGRALNSHDVASAMSPFSQEVSCYVDHNISMPAQNLWQVRLSNPKDTGNNWHTINSRLQLIHMNSSLALRFSGRQLPDWGFHQHEIVADKELNNDDTIWNVEEHSYTKSEDQRERELGFGKSEFLPLEATKLTFFEKFWELHYKLLNYQQDSIKDHLYACESPLDWLTMSKGTAYWVDDKPNSNAQIFLIGNTSTNLTAIFSAIVFSILFIFLILRRRRKIFSDMRPETWTKMETQAVALFTGYLFHFIPYFTYESPLFFQYYLTATVFKLLIVGATIEHLNELTKKTYIIHGAALLIVSKSIDTFVKLIPLTYGTELTREELQALRWKDTWQLINTT